MHAIGPWQAKPSRHILVHELSCSALASLCAHTCVHLPQILFHKGERLDASWSRHQHASALGVQPEVVVALRQALKLTQDSCSSLGICLQGCRSKGNFLG